MENPTENPSKATEYLQELNRIIETQQELLEKQRVRIEQLEVQVTDLCSENARLKDQHQRHLAACRPPPLQQLGAIKEHVLQEKPPIELNLAAWSYHTALLRPVSLGYVHTRQALFEKQAV
ncbi:hypothetical protein NHX12_030309 [Muraenolepis orangiensis]|uniref:Uncharacterized protein n=1 Tax=Muraenolepis orangiensis TaxID=630683 RepID=A0A9Q0E7I1_9TELE|nr:hypothetical protein NHX12_030309 [Muraenolepis orangiensis]